MKEKYSLIIPLILTTQFFAFASGNELRITKNQTWNESMTVSSDLIVEGKSALTIKSTVSFAEGCKFIIKTGGKLILDGGTLTNACGDIWQGIEVWGNPNAPQNPFSQGVLVIQNGGKIENAEVAVRAGSHYYTGKGGGMVMVMDAVFYNNDMAVKFDPYSHDPSNQSYFTNCTFDYDKTITGEPDMTFVRLEDVDFVDFNSCTFSNHTNRDYFGWGIWSNNSILVVDGDCIEYSGNSCLLWDQSKFYHLEYGIYVTNSNTTNYPEIQHTFFNDNYRGIFISGVTNALVKYCEFVVNTPFETNGGYGLYLDNCTAYTIEENFFSPTYENRIGIGLIVNNSGGDPNEVYRNSFSYLQQGVSAQELNRGFNDPAQGLQILCCDFTNCDNDILVPKPSRKGWGIAPEQGADSPDATDMAGNLFFIEDPTPDGDFDDINNEGGHFTYYYPINTQDDDVRPIDYTYNTVTIYPVFVSLQNGWTYNDGCPLNENGGGGSGEEEMRLVLHEKDEEITVMEITLSVMVDGGKTELLNDEVLTSLPPEALALYNELMSESPNLSETVTGSTIEKEEVIPGSMLRDIMVANPHTSKSDILMDKLDERENPLPDYMKAQILAGRSLVSVKEELESKIARKKLYKARAFNGLVHHYLAPGYGAAGMDSLVALYMRDNGLPSKYRLAMLYLDKGMYQQGEDLLDSLPSAYNLHGDDLESHQDMVEFYTLSVAAISSGGWQQATPAQKGQLYQLADATAPASVYARNVLIALGEIEYNEPVQVPDLLKSSRKIDQYNTLLDIQQPSVLEVFPNPANGFVILAFNLDVITAYGTIEIKTLEGKLVTTLRVTEPKDQLTVVTNGWKAGAYIATLTVNGRVAGSVTFTIIN